MDTSATTSHYRAPRKTKKVPFLRRMVRKILGQPENSALIFEHKSAARISPPSGWIPPEKTLMVIGSQRSGSTLLCSLMRQTGLLGKPDEFFKKTPYEYWKITDDSIPLRCGLVASHGSTDNGVCSLKVFSYHLDRIQKHIALQDWFPNLTFIWIRRRDILGQVISSIIARQTGRYRSFYQETGATPEYQAEEIALALHRAALDEARWRVYLARTGLPYREVYYEDLAADPRKTLAEVAAAVGVEIDLSELSLEKSGMSVQRSDINKEWRARFLAEQGDPNFFHMKLCGSP